MAKETLLDFVQDILSDADGDNVDSISDTVESDQCARIIRDVWRQVVSQHDMEHIKTLKQLTATSATTPTVMERPENFHSLEWVRYDSRLAATDPQSFKRVQYMDPDSFVEYCSQFSTDETNVEAMTLSTGHIIPIQNDRAPKYFTIMDFGSDELVFDAYDSDLETNLQASKSLAYGTFSQDLTLADSSSIDLPRHLAVLVKREARAMYFDLYKDGITSEIDRTRRRAEVRAQRQRKMTSGTDNNTGPDYGRK